MQWLHVTEEIITYIKIAFKMCAPPYNIIYDGSWHQINEDFIDSLRDVFIRIESYP